MDEIISTTSTENKFINAGNEAMKIAKSREDVIEVETLPGVKWLSQQFRTGRNRQTDFIRRRLFPK